MDKSARSVEESSVDGAIKDVLVDELDAAKAKCVQAIRQTFFEVRSQLVKCACSRCRIVADSNTLLRIPCQHHVCRSCMATIISSQSKHVLDNRAFMREMRNPTRVSWALEHPQRSSCSPVSASESAEEESWRVVALRALLSRLLACSACGSVCVISSYQPAFDGSYLRPHLFSEYCPSALFGCRSPSSILAMPTRMGGSTLSTGQKLDSYLESTCGGTIKTAPCASCGSDGVCVRASHFPFLCCKVLSRHYCRHRPLRTVTIGSLTLFWENRSFHFRGFSHVGLWPTLRQKGPSQCLFRMCGRHTQCGPGPLLHVPSIRIVPTPAVVS